MTYLDYGIKARTGFILITGEIGSGKTTIIRDLIKKKIPKVVLSKVFNTKVSSEQLISMINDDFGLPVQGKDKIELLRDLNEFLIKQFAKGTQPILIIDEAQNLSPELLEEVRMLSNLETNQAKLLQIILVGQPELKRILTSPDMLQLRQRININCHIQPLNEEETREYILHRLEKAGNRQAAVFSPEAVALVHVQSRGVPRLINIICDFFMLSMFSAETKTIDGATAREILKELDFEQQFWKTEVRNTELKVDDTNNELHKTKVKLSMLLRDITQRIDILEKNSMKYNESILLDITGRVSAIERSVAEYAQRLEELKNQKHSPPGEQLALPGQPPSGNGDQNPGSRPQEEQAEPQAKNFFRRLFGG
jgi:putative secretion ATPase (PEP-CTERM system associated)